MFIDNCFVERYWFIYVICMYLLVSNTISRHLQEYGSSDRALSGVGAAQSSVFCVVFFRSVSIIFLIFFLLLYCLDFDLHFMITPVIYPDVL